MLAVALGRLSVSAALGSPLLDRFNSTEAPTKDAVWAVTRSAQGELLVGSNVLTVFDGHEWQTIDVPGAYAFRALAAARHGSRVYVGAINAIGYVERDDMGQWHYASLLSALRQPVKPDVWQVLATEHGAIWVTSGEILRWDGRSFQIESLPAQPRLYASRDAGALWVYQSPVGLLRVDEQGTRLVVPEKDLPVGPVIWALGVNPTEARLGTIEPRPILLGTADAVFVRRGDEWVRLAAVSAAVGAKLPVSGAWIDRDAFAVGTLRGGLVLASVDDRVTATYSSHTDLPDDAVYGLQAEADGDLWLGQGNGLARIAAVGHAELFDRRHGLDAGIPRRVVGHEGRTYLVTAQAAYQLVKDPSLANRLQQIVGLDSVLWDAAVIDARLWFAGFGGLWRLTPDGVQRERFVSTDVQRVRSLSRLPGAVVFTEGYSLKALVFSKNNWATRDLGVQLGDTPVSWVEDASGDLWASTMIQGIYHDQVVTDDPEQPRLRLVARFRAGVGLPTAANRPRLIRVGAQLYAFTDTAILKLNGAGTAFEPVTQLADFIGVTASPDGQYWLVQRREFARFGAYSLLRMKDDAASLAWETLEMPGLETVGAISSLDLVKDGGLAPSLWIGGANGVLRYDLASLRPITIPLAVSVRRIVVNNGEFTGAASRPGTEFPAEVKRLEFSFPAGFSVEGGDGFYQTWLEGVETNWSPPQREPVREFTGLAPGSYFLHLRAIAGDGRAGPETMYAFGLAAPWWRRVPALVGYGIAGLVLIATGVQWRLRHLRRQTAELNRLVSERTRELALANTAKSEFLENVSHEIRNPLNGLVGLVGMLREDNLQPRERDVARSLKACAQTLGRVFEEVLNFSKLEYGAVTAEAKPFSLRAALEEVTALFAANAEQRGCTITLVMPEDFRDGFIGDEGKLKSIVGNFVSNALKYAPGGPVQIKVESSTKPPPGQDDTVASVSIEVRDHGPGIPPEEQALIFQKFVRGKRAKSGRVAGTGLGLAACQAYARLLGGVVGVESEPGRGAMFYLQLPLQRGPLPESPAPAVLSLSTGDAALIVEDQDYNRVVLADIAEELGYVPEEATDVAGARVRLLKKAYGVIFLDWELPDGKGTEIAAWLRGRPGGSVPVVIATTAHDSPEIREQCRAAGMDAFALKPFSGANIRELVATVFAQRLMRETGSGESGSNGQSLASRHATLWPEGRPELPASATPWATENPGAETLNLRAFEHFGRRAGAEKQDPREIYLRILDEEVAQTVAAAEAGRADAMARAAHRVRSHAGLIGASALNATARETEGAARLNDRERWPTLLVRLQTEAQHLRSRICSAPSGADRPG